MTTGGRRVGGSRTLAFRARPIVVAACATIAAAVLGSGCSSSGSDSRERASHSARAQRTGSLVAGSLVQADGLGNTVIGGADRTALAFRFRATWTGSVVAVRCYVIKNVNGRTGYSEGDGGTMRVSLQADSGRRPHVPVGRHLAAAMFRPAERGVFPLVRFDKPARIAAGRLYYVVFSNVGSDPERNYVSINALYSASRLGRRPAIPDGLAVLEGGSSGGGATRWTPRRSRPHEYYLPILDVVGAGPGQHGGLGYMEVWDPKPIGGGAIVRQLLRAPGARSTRVDGVWLRVRRIDGADASLVLRLERPDGYALASASVAPGHVPTSDPGWVHVPFSKPVSMAPATHLALTASAAKACSYEAFPIRKGTGFGFDPTTFFDGGYAQFNDGSGWVGWDQWGGHDRRNSDLQFALDVVG
jgi:hypothetical protein